MARSSRTPRASSTQSRLLVLSHFAPQRIDQERRQGPARAGQGHHLLPSAQRRGARSRQLPQRARARHPASSPTRCTTVCSSRRSPKIAKSTKTASSIARARARSKRSMNVGVDMEAARPKLKTLDTDFQKTLLKVHESARIAYLTTGHGEINEGGRSRGAHRQRRPQALRVPELLGQRPGARAGPRKRNPQRRDHRGGVRARAPVPPRAK